LSLEEEVAEEHLIFQIPVFQLQTLTSFDMRIIFITLALGALAQAQRLGPSSTTTPVPILKQINKVNEDGSYTYGYENADGSYKIETKDANGQVQGKYGYYDDENTLREIEYGASRAGFFPQGTGIKAPEVAAHVENPNAPQDGSYDPEIFTYPYQPGYTGPNSIQPVQSVAQPAQGRRLRVKTVRKQSNAARQLNLFQQQQYQQPQAQDYQQQQQYYQQPQAQPQQQYYQQPQQQQQQSQLPSYYQAQPQAPAFHPSQLFQGHPARNFDLNTGSYSVSYGHQG